MRAIVGSEADAFSFTLAGALVIAASLLIGWLATPWAGLLVFAIAAVTNTAAAVFVYALRRDRPAVLRHAASETPSYATRGARHVLVVANEALAGDELADLIRQRGGEHVVVDVLAPVLASRLHYAVSDIDRELAKAHTRLERSLAWAHERRIVAQGELGDPNPTTALEDELRTFGADEVIVVTHPRDCETWQEHGELARLRRELDVPVTHVIVRHYRGQQQTSIDPS